MHSAIILLLFIGTILLYSIPDAKIQRTLYVVPKTLPENHTGKIFGYKPQITVWTGARLNKNGHLTVPEIQLKSDKYHLLVGLTSAVAGETVLRLPLLREKSISEIARFTASHPSIAGIQLDFEYLDPTLAHAFVAYAANLRKAIHPLKLFVAVFPPKGMPASWSAFHKLTELADAANGLVVMLYDYHRQGTEPGCVSGIGWLDENAAALAKLPREKIWLGAPLYGYRFEGKKATAIRRRSFENIKSPERQADGCRSKPSSQGVAYYPAEALYAHYEKLVQKYGFAGIAYWRAGLEQ